MEKNEIRLVEITHHSHKTSFQMSALSEQISPSIRFLIAKNWNRQEVLAVSYSGPIQVFVSLHDR